MDSRWRPFLETVKNQAQLIAYVDRFAGGGFREFQRLLRTSIIRRAFSSIFIRSMAPMPASTDRSHRVDPRLGAWDDVRALGEHVKSWRI
jgi:hypothetical protein